MNRQGQASIEFAFAMIIALLMAFALMRLFDWSGRDMIDRRQTHEKTLFTTEGSRNYSVSDLSTSRQLQQVDPVIMPSTRFDGVWSGN